MIPWIKAPTRRILRERNQRMAEGRVARDSEAQLELLALQANDETGYSERELATSLGWSPGKLRRALEVWAKDAEELGDTALAPARQTRPNPANQRRTTGDSETNHERLRREPDSNQPDTGATPPFDDARTTGEPEANQARITGESQANPTRALTFPCLDREGDRDRDLSTRARPTEPGLFAEPAPPAPAKRRKSTPAGPSEDEVVAACAPAWRAIRGLTGSETPKATDQKALLALWRGVRGDYTEASAFGADLLLVATWAHSDEPAARQTIQGLNLNGSRWGIDRSRDVATITRQDRWADRLAKARQFAQAASEARQAISTGPDLSGPILTERERASRDLTRRQDEFIAKQNEEWGSLPHSQNRYRRLNELLPPRPTDLTVT